MRKLKLIALAAFCLGFLGTATANNDVSSNSELVQIEIAPAPNGFSSYFVETVAKYISTVTSYSTSILLEMYLDGTMTIEKENGFYRVTLNIDGGLGELFIIDSL